MMAVGGGTGSTISFSTIRDFYGDTNPVVFSDFNRRSSNDGLVDATFVGSSTATTSTGSGTKNDFGVTVANDSTSATISHGFNINGTSFTIDTGTAGGSTTTLTVFCQSGSTGQYTIKQNGTQIGTVGEGLTVNLTVNDGGNITIEQSQGDPQAGSATYTRLTRVYDVTFTNNNSTGDTYTLASSSTGHSTKSVYAAGDSQQVKNNSGSNQWTIAYDNVSGSGSGTAGDIGVTVASQTDTRTTSTGFVSGQNTTCTLQVPSHSGLSFVSATGSVSEPNNDSNSGCTLKLNGTTVATGFAQQASGSSATYTGSASPGDTFQILGGETGRSLSITFTTPSRSIVFQNNGSSSLTLGSSSTGGARTIAASASSTVQSAGSAGGFTNNQAWQVHFDTGSGNCNVGIPTTIGSGNPVNLDLFNTVTTPIG